MQTFFAVIFVVVAQHAASADRVLELEERVKRLTKLNAGSTAKFIKITWNLIYYITLTTALRVGWIKTFVLLLQTVVCLNTTLDKCTQQKLRNLKTW